jgi:L-alanine-DL-glutamate epimerase-like enolase superfamily enzyme
MRITCVETHHLRLPAPRQRIPLTGPGRADGVDFLAVTVTTDSETTGLGFTTVDAGAAAVRSLLENDFPPLLLGEDPLRVERHFARARERFRGAGWAGLAARAYAAFDIALWDLKAKAAGLPLYQLLGGARTSAPVYLADLATPGREPAETLKLAKPLVEQGALGLLVEVGGDDVQLDADRVQQLRDGLGENAWLGIDARGRYDLGTALAMAHFYEEDVGVDRYEAPLPAGDGTGYRRLAERMEVPLALGATFGERDDFRRLLEEGSVRVLRPDPLRLGGLTPFLKLAALAEAYPVTVTPYRLPEIAVHLACGLPNIDAVDFTPALAAAFADPPRVVNGHLAPPERPGHGLELSDEALGKYRV